ncbi:MAG: hypothetical protein MUD12_16765 [Spirochaetes bacterium]|jgi:hypothetical protein|nr:hypothetical protein [Spirochaetota bacterium]
MNNQFSKRDSLLNSINSGIKTGTAVFGVIECLDLVAGLVDKLLYAMSVPVWNAWDKYTGKKAGNSIKKNDDAGCPSAEEMFASLSAEDQLRFRLAIRDYQRKHGLIK